MKKISNKKKAVLLGTATAVVYSAIKGNGIFNKPRFFKQNNAIKKYLKSTRPNAVIGDIIKTSQGWASVINDGGERFLLNITKSKDNNYIFSEENM